MPRSLDWQRLAMEACVVAPSAMAEKYVQLDRGFECGSFLIGVQRFEDTFRSNVGRFGCSGHGSGS